jgi:signal transduction histidine kinase
MQIRTRLTLQFTLLVSGLLLLSFLAVFFFARWQWDQEFNHRLFDKAITSATLLLKVEQVDSALLKIIDRAKQDYLFRENISIFDEALNELYTSNDTIDFRLSARQFEEVQKEGRVQFTMEPFSVVGISFFHQQRNYYVLAGAINREAEQNLSLLFNLLATIFVIWIAVVALAGWVYAGRALRPIQRLMENIENITSSSLNRRLEGAEKTDEIGKLALMFNRLLERLENAFTLQKTFVANVSHELRNPLTKVTSQLEVTLLKPRDAAMYLQTVTSVLEDVREMNQLTNSLLDLAKLTQDGGGFTMARVRLDEILLDARQAVLKLDPAYDIRIFFESMPEDAEQLHILGNVTLLKTAFVNVLENACKFSANRTASVWLEVTPQQLRVRIENPADFSAVTISPDEASRVFEPFYRLPGSASVKGYGIGLSLAQRIVSIHRGTISFSAASGSACVNLAFPTF